MMGRKQAVWGQEETVAALEEISRMAAAGELHCIALRLFHHDDTYEDLVFGGSEEEQANALAKLRATDD